MHKALYNMKKVKNKRIYKLFKNWRKKMLNFKTK